MVKVPVLQFRPAIVPGLFYLVIHENMFDIGWSELLIIGVMALIVVGPKDLPVLLRTLGRYIGIIRRQATEFRSQFDEVLRETELDQIRKDMAGIKQDVTSTVSNATRQVERDIASAGKDASVKDAIEGNGEAKAGANPSVGTASDNDGVAAEEEVTPGPNGDDLAKGNQLETEPSGERVNTSAEKSGAH